MQSENESAVRTLQPAAALPASVAGLRIPARVHLLGAGGAGVSGAALLLAARGVEVTCSDRAESEHTAMLRAAGVPIEIGSRSASRLPRGVGLLVRSAAVPLTDPCVVDATESGVAVIKYSELVARLAPAGRTLAVAGTHGKTSSTWMLYHALAGLAGAREVGAATDAPLARGLPAPGALVGGICAGLERNAVAPSDGGWFAVEACEYDRSFLGLSPFAAAITNVEADHLDYYGDLDAIRGAFARFADRLHPDGLLVTGPQVPRRIEEAARCPVWRLGRELQLIELDEERGRFTFGLRGPGFHVTEVTLPVPGRHQVDNAALALALVAGVAARESGRSAHEAARLAAEGIARYPGCGRRFEAWGRVGSVEVVHDYAHHPTEVRVTLETARRAYPGQPLHVLFQPHQYSRTARFLDEFAACLATADRVVLSDVYGARNHLDGEPTAGAPELAAAVVREGGRAQAAGPLETSVERFVDGLPSGCAALVLGAGDIGRIRNELLERLALRGAARSGSLR